MNLTDSLPTAPLINDAKMPFLAAALEPAAVEQQFQQCLPQIARYQLQRIRLFRYKPERRCLIEYQWINDQRQTITLIGKVRAKGTDYQSYHLQQKLWQSSFAEHSEDGISVPEPIGVIPEWQMWVQRRVKGAIATPLFAQTHGTLLAQRMAEVAHKLHQIPIASHRYHSMATELEILRDRLTVVIQNYPHWQPRLERLLTACHELGSQIIEPVQCGIHRDFYPDQIIVDGSRLYLLDLDLYCVGNPALDIGNFVGHLQEYSLRQFGHPAALRDREVALIERFVQLAGEAFRPAIAAYTTLTLVRHIYLSTQFSDRRPFTEMLLQLCEKRLDK